MKEAVNKVQNKELTLRKAAEIFAVPFTSLQRRVTSSRGIIKRRGGQPALDENAEKKLADRLLHLASRGFGITPKAVRMPPGTEVAMTEKGWVTEEAFKLWLQHFNRYRTPGKVVLILDGHASHTSYSVVDLCDSFEIELVLLPPHTSHALQPLDVSFFKPLKTYYHQKATSWQHSHPNQGITKVAFGALYQQAWNQAATVGNATKGFEKTGIFPLNANAIPDHKFIGDQESDIVESQVQSSSSQQMQLQVQATNTQPVADTGSSASSRQSDKAHSSTCADEERKKMKNKATPGIKIKSSSAKQRECRVPQVQSSSEEQVQSKIKVKVQATNTKPLDNIVLSTSSQHSDKAQPSTCAEIIKEILPSPLKSPIASKRIRKVSKLVLHLTSPQSKTTLLEKETKKKFKVDNKTKENKKKAVGKEKTMKKMKNKAKPAINIKSSSAKQRVALHLLFRNIRSSTIRGLDSVQCLRRMVPRKMC
ncbi:unnamed protein product [Arctia plantaginis]|uniref:Uncharacterized protein n=1 Tax=Arctia plantaginis TaxID=874455 RepID=A0A8S0ZF05_ARCPL|nr:unnamed protein product [Arctia plantaginis]